MRLQMRPNKIVVEVIKEEETTSSGIILNSVNEDVVNPHDTILGLVIYSGRDTGVNKGDKVLFEQRFSFPCEIKCNKYRVLKADDLIGVYKEN